MSVLSFGIRGFMPPELASELWDYGSALCVMQRLGAKHHYVHSALNSGRAALPPGLAAFLRRRANLVQSN